MVSRMITVRGKMLRRITGVRRRVRWAPVLLIIEAVDDKKAGVAGVHHRVEQSLLQIIGHPAAHAELLHRLRRWREDAILDLGVVLQQLDEQEPRPG